MGMALPRRGRPATVLVWGWASTVLKTFGTPYYTLFDRSTLQGVTLVALLARLALSIPMALDAGRSERFWTAQQTGFRRLGVAGACIVLLGLALDKATYDARRSSALASIRSNLSVVVFYLGREKEFPRVGRWIVGIHAPFLGSQYQSLELVVRDEAFANGKNVAVESQSMDTSKPNRTYYSSPTDLSFTALGPHPRYSLRIGGQEMKSGDLQAEAVN